MLIEMPELGTLEGKQAASLAGLAPMSRQSGKRQGKERIQGGRALLRRAIYMPALVATRCTKAVGPALGLTPILNQSGESSRVGRISRCGDNMMRTLLYEAAQVMLTRTTRWSWLKAWAMNVARRRGLQKAIVALARRLAVIMHRIWSDGTEFRWTREKALATT
jgi:transposase